MKLSESLSLLRKLQYIVDQRDLHCIARICTLLSLPQKTIAVSYYNFFAVKSKSKIEPDDVTLVSSAVDLSCKMCETIRATDKIIRLTAEFYLIDITEPDIMQLYIAAVGKTEIEILYFIDFNFEMTEIYVNLERICRERDRSPLFRKRCWILLNDILSTPISIYFTIDELLACTLFINFVVERFKPQNYTENDAMYSHFISTFDEFSNVTLECIDLMFDEVMSLYSS